MTSSEKKALSRKAEEIAKYKEENFNSVEKFHENLIENGYEGNLAKQYFSDRVSAMRPHKIDNSIKSMSKKAIQTITDYVDGIHSLLFNRTLKFCGNSNLALLITQNFKKDDYPIRIDPDSYKLNFQDNGNVTMISKYGTFYNGILEKEDDFFTISWNNTGSKYKIEGYDHNSDLAYLPVVFQSISKDRVSSSYGLITREIILGLEGLILNQFLYSSFSSIQTPYNIPKPTEDWLHINTRKFLWWNFRYFLYDMSHTMRIILVFIPMYLIALFIFLIVFIFNSYLF